MARQHVARWFVSRREYNNTKKISLSKKKEKIAARRKAWPSLPPYGVNCRPISQAYASRRWCWYLLAFSRKSTCPDYPAIQNMPTFPYDVCVCGWVGRGSFICIWLNVYHKTGLEDFDFDSLPFRGYCTHRLDTLPLFQVLPWSV